MHRTQVLFDDAQYLSLREAARRAGLSMGELVRQFVARGLGRQSGGGGRKPRLQAFSGIFSEPNLDAADHDRILYGDDE